MFTVKAVNSHNSRFTYLSKIGLVYEKNMIAFKCLKAFPSAHDGETEVLTVKIECSFYYALFYINLEEQSS